MPPIHHNTLTSVLPIHLLRIKTHQSICRTSDSLPAAIQDMGIDHRGAHILMAKQLPDRPNMLPTTRFHRRFSGTRSTWYTKEQRDEEAQ